MPAVTHDRSVQKRKAEKPRRSLTTRERRAKRTQSYVTWLLAFVFGITSVGFLISFKPADQAGPDNPQTEKQVLLDRLKAVEKMSQESPTQAQWCYDQARIYLELAQLPGAMPSDRYPEKASEQLRGTLKRSPSHLPALQDLARLYSSEGKNQEAVNVLTEGMNAEKTALAEQNKSRAQGEPEIPPDATLRALLFKAYILMGGHEKQAASAAHEALRLNPSEFTRELYSLSLQLAIENKKSDAIAATQIALKEAQALKDATAVEQLQRMLASINSINMQAVKPSSGPVTPSGAPAAGSVTTTSSATPGGGSASPAAP